MKISVCTAEHYTILLIVAQYSVQRKTAIFYILVLYFAFLILITIKKKSFFRNRLQGTVLLCCPIAYSTRDTWAWVDCSLHKNVPEL